MVIQSCADQQATSLRIGIKLMRSFFLMYRSDRRNDFLLFCVTLRQTANIRLHCGKNKMVHQYPNTFLDIAVHLLKPVHTNVLDADAENNSQEY